MLSVYALHLALCLCPLSVLCLCSECVLFRIPSVCCHVFASIHTLTVCFPVCALTVSVCALNLCSEYLLSTCALDGRAFDARSRVPTQRGIPCVLSICVPSKRPLLNPETCLQVRFPLRYRRCQDLIKCFMGSVAGVTWAVFQCLSSQVCILLVHVYAHLSYALWAHLFGFISPHNPSPIPLHLSPSPSSSSIERQAWKNMHACQAHQQWPGLGRMRQGADAHNRLAGAAR